MGAISQEEKDSLFDSLFATSDMDGDYDSADKVLDTPVLAIDLDSINSEAQKQAKIITERLSNYYFDQKYIDNHPYIPSKIMQEMDNIRRLLKMLAINEKAQDVLISSISMNMGKSTLYQNLTSMQNAMISTQNQLNNLTSQLENIFKEMQAECDKTFAEKPKDAPSEDGTMTVRGSKEFIEALNAQLYGNENKIDKENSQEKKYVIENGNCVDPDTGEIVENIVSTDKKLFNDNIEGEATYADIVAM